MSTDTDTSAPGTVRDIALTDIITATGTAVADDIDNAVVVFRADGEGVRQVATDIRIGDVRGFFGLDAAVRPGFGEARVKVKLDGPAGQERYRQLHEVVDRHCPVLDLFSNPTRVVTALVAG